MKKIEIDSKQFQNVLKKAIEKKPLVRVGAENDLYFVRASGGDFYPVRFQRSASGAMLGACLCEGAMKGFHCYHLAAALLAHSAFVRAGLRAPAPRRECSPMIRDITSAAFL